MPSAVIPIAGKLFSHARNAYHRIPGQATATKGGQMEALTSIVFATIALEAFINELSDFPALFPDSIEPVFATFAGLMEELEKSRASIVSKFWLARWIFTSSPHDKGKEPYQNFALLIELRNALVHSRSLSKLDYDGSTGRFVPTPHEEPAVISKLASKHILAEFPESEVIWITRLATKATALWACNAASAMVRSLLDVLPKGQFSDTLRRVYDQDFSEIK